jgi:hypothetical protein
MVPLGVLSSANGAFAGIRELQEKGPNGQVDCALHLWREYVVTMAARLNARIVSSGPNWNVGSSHPKRGGFGRVGQDFNEGTFSTRAL